MKSKETNINHTVKLLPFGENERGCNQVTDNVFKHIKTLADFSQNIIFTDPPYQLGSQWYICDKTGEYKLKGTKSDFMQKWDGLDHNDLNLFFKESHRILK